jgi:hypothetical protein
LDLLDEGGVDDGGGRVVEHGGGEAGGGGFFGGVAGEEVVEDFGFLGLWGRGEVEGDDGDFFFGGGGGRGFGNEVAAEGKAGVEQEGDCGGD